MTLTAPTLDNLTLNITHDIHVRASLEDTFEALLEQIGPANETPDGKPLPLTIEPRPGGRCSAIWETATATSGATFRRSSDRPCWQITGPLFMSAPVISNVQYRLKQVSDGTLIAFRHSAFGFVPEEHRDGVARGWTPLFERIKKQAEALSNSGRRH